MSKDKATKMAASVEEIDAAEHVVVSELAEITTPKSGVFLQ